MNQIMFAWLGETDLKAAEGNENIGEGPIASAVRKFHFDQVVILNNYIGDTRCERYLSWLREGEAYRGIFTLSPCKLSSPIHFGDIYLAAEKVVSETLSGKRRDTIPFFHLSPGTPAMSAVWILLSKGRFSRAKLIQSSREQGVQEVDLPFDIVAQFVPSLERASAEQLREMGAVLPPLTPEFQAIIQESTVMKEEVAKARLVSLRDVPVLIEGETGTGKELFARLIHACSRRNRGPFIDVNCGAIPRELVESELFGHKRGAFTGAERDREGYFEAADRGTLFLDELGELPLDAQVKILRVIQESKVVRVGETTPKSIDVRIIAATNRNLLKEVAAGRFRSDLFYRLAVAMIRLPPLRERKVDLGPMADYMLFEINKELSTTSGYVPKKLSQKAKTLLLQHSWPGNARELYNTLLRVCVWTTAAQVSEAEMQRNLLPAIESGVPLDHDIILEEGFCLEDHLSNVARRYIEKALKECGGVKKRAAKRLGFKNYQTLSNWIDKYQIGN